MARWYESKRVLGDNLLYRGTKARLPRQDLTSNGKPHTFSYRVLQGRSRKDRPRNVNG